jgi:ATP-binding protein involved in chromosome partitioning
MNLLSSEDILRALRTVVDPELGRDLVSLRMIHDVQVEDGVVQFTLRLTTPACPIRNQLEHMAREAVAALPGVREVRMKIDARVPVGYGRPQQQRLPGVRQIIAVASGKGGVGKSTVAALRASHWRWPKRARGSACSTPTSTAPTCRRCSAARAPHLGE